MRTVMVCPDLRVDRRILQEAQTLSAHGHEVILFAGWSKDLPKVEQQDHVRILRPAPPTPTAWEKIFEQTNGYVRRHSVLKHGRMLFTLSTRIAQYFMRGCQSLTPLERELIHQICDLQPDYLHVHDLPQLRLGVEVKKLLGVPLIYDAHELFPALEHLGWAYRKVWHRREQRYLPWVDRVITVNPLVAEEMQNRYRIAMPTVIQNAIDSPPDFDPTVRHTKLRDELGLSPDQKILLYQGCLLRSRGLEPLIDAMSSVQAPVHLVLLGYGDLKELLRARIAQLPGATRVHLLDAVPHEELLGWTASADAGVIPYQAKDLNKKLVSPNKLYEFIQAGLPMLSNDLPMLRRMIGEQELGLLWSFSDASSYARGIDAFFADEERVRAYRHHVLFARQTINWRNEGKKLLALYEQLPKSGARLAA